MTVRRIRRWSEMAALIVVITVSSPMLLAESSKHRLLPAARTFLTLQLCSSYLLEHEQDASLAEQDYATAGFLQIADLIREAPTGYAPNGDVADLVWCNSCEEVIPVQPEAGVRQLGA